MVPIGLHCLFILFLVQQLLELSAYGPGSSVLGIFCAALQRFYPLSSGGRRYLHLECSMDEHALKG